MLGDPDLSETIARKYRLKNTTGYGLNALVDFETPLAIFEHLLVGSEGTLAFIAEITLTTVPVEPHRRTALLLFPTLDAACQAVADLDRSGARAIELMDGPALLSVGDDLATVTDASLVDATTLGLLVEWRASSEAELAAILPVATEVVGYSRSARAAGASPGPRRRGGHVGDPEGHAGNDRRTSPARFVDHLGRRGLPPGEPCRRRLGPTAPDGRARL